jgi:hypothetical protein
MRHVDDGSLRRMQDEPFSIPDVKRQHVAGCPECRERAAAMGADAALAAMLVGPRAQFDASSALSQVRGRIASDEITPSISRWGRLTAALQLRSYRLVRPASAAAAAAILVGAVALTPAGSAAQSFFTIFQPKQIVVVPITPGELRLLPPLAKFGTLHTSGSTTKPKPVDSAAAASTVSGLAVLVPSSLPPAIPSSVTYQVIAGTTSTFTFSAAKAKAAAAALHKALPPMPARVNGSTLQLETSPAVVTTYGKADATALVIGQMRAPKISSTGVSVSELENYLLSLPGVTPQLRSELKAIGNPDTTLPIPVPVNVANAQSVSVQGVKGISIGDSTGLGSGVVWTKNGVIYGVAGSLSESQVVAIANSLH